MDSDVEEDPVLIALKSAINKNKSVREFEENGFKKKTQIGSGGYSVVYKSTLNSSDVAIKRVIKLTWSQFLEEVRQLSQVEHENIVKLYGYCYKSDPMFMVMEYADCGSLHTVLHGIPQPFFTTGNAFSWLHQIATACDYLHTREPPIIHRDLKPANVLVFQQGVVVKICDFGTARELGDEMTKEKGTRFWAAPEVFQGSAYNEKCDVFSLGVIIWEIISRQLPIRDFTSEKGITTVKDPKFIELLPSDIWILLQKCLDRDPSKRPTMTEIVEELTGRFDQETVEPIVFLREGEKPPVNVCLLCKVKRIFDCWHTKPIRIDYSKHDRFTVGNNKSSFKFYVLDDYVLDVAIEEGDNVQIEATCEEKSDKNPLANESANWATQFCASITKASGGK